MPSYMEQVMSKSDSQSINNYRQIKQELEENRYEQRSSKPSLDWQSCYRLLRLGLPQARSWLSTEEKS